MPIVKFICLIVLVSALCGIPLDSIVVMDDETPKAVKPIGVGYDQHGGLVG